MLKLAVLIVLIIVIVMTWNLAEIIIMNVMLNVQRMGVNHHVNHIPVINVTVMMPIGMIPVVLEKIRSKNVEQVVILEVIIVMIMMFIRIM